MFYDNFLSLVRFATDKMQKVNLYKSQNSFCDLYCLMPNQFQKIHSHASEDKIYFALSGECSVQIGNEIKVLKAGESCIANAGIQHGVTNNSSNNAVLLVFMTKV